MALTRAQLLAGDSGQGIVLGGQVQAVTAGSGVQINGSGVLSINGSDPTFNGFIKTNNSSAYNAYVWPAGPIAAPGQQLTILNAAGDLGWTKTLGGLGVSLTGTFPNQAYNLSVPIQFGPPAAGTAPAGAIDGSEYWDDNLGLEFIRYNDGTSTQWVQTIPSSPGGTVTFVGIAGTQGISVVSGSPVTASGTITLGFNLSALPTLP